MIALLAGVAFAADPCADPPELLAERSAEIAAIYDASEAEAADRSASATSVLKRDEKRVKALKKLDAKGLLCTPDDKWKAAWVMEQSDDLDVLERAFELAQEAMAARHPNGPWLVAFTFDRKRVAGGYRQTYGSQTAVNPAGQRCLVELESSGVTDADRQKYGHPTLEQRYRQLLDQAGFKGDEATLDRLQRRGLSCPPMAFDPKAQKRVAEPD